MKRYGYVRVSSRDQNPERQIQALRQYGLSEKSIYVDQISGKDFLRPAYQKLIGKIGENDVIVVKSIDRLGRNYGEILDQWRIITKEKKADIEVLDMPLLNTNSKIEGLTGRLISDIVLQLLAYVAQTEREFIRQRQAEGIAVAKANGVKFGGKKKPLPKGFEECFQRWEKWKCLLDNNRKSFV